MIFCLSVVNQDMRSLKPKLSPVEAVDLIHGAGGIAFLAHPRTEGFSIGKTLLETIKFDGIEVWHPSAENEIPTWIELAKNYRLLASGGSDFHGDSGRFPKFRRFCNFISKCEIYDRIYIGVCRFGGGHHGSSCVCRTQRHRQEL